jgi:serine protease AprX
MMRRTFCLALLVAVAAGPAWPRADAAVAPLSSPLDGKIAPGLARMLLAPSAPDTVAVWIFLADRGPEGPGKGAFLGACLSPRASARRLLRGGAPYDERDLPVASAYIDMLRPHLAKLRTASRYFNAVSAAVKTGELGRIAAFPFVARIDAVAVGRAEDAGRGGTARASATSLPVHEYGPSTYQLQQAGITALLERGVNGSGASTGSPPVFIGILDTGFDRRHVALRRVVVEAERDFINDDAVTANQPGDPPGQDFHGTEVLGVIAGLAEGELIGSAYGAHFALAKTEIASQEIMIEEDYWVAGIEWEDSLGVDVVTSSLGYIDWYTPAQLDGRTALSTRAASVAVSHGICVVNSAGNGGPAAMSLLAPADGDSVLTIGAVDRFGGIAQFSSRGPTADGRTKPDFAAMGVSDWTVSASDTAAYNALSGTSFSAPLFAGGVALLLELHPTWNPIQVREALRATASNSAFPNNTYGWGIPDFSLAAGFPSSLVSLGPHPNPFRGATTIRISMASPEVVTIKVYDAAGTLVRTLVDGELRGGVFEVTWDGTNNEGRQLASGVYFIRTRGHTFKTISKAVRVR